MTLTDSNDVQQQVEVNGTRQWEYPIIIN